MCIVRWWLFTLLFMHYMIHILWFSVINHFYAKKSLLTGNCTLSNSFCSRTNRMCKSRFSKVCVFVLFFCFVLFRSDHWCASLYKVNTRMGERYLIETQKCTSTATSERCKAFFFFKCVAETKHIHRPWNSYYLLLKFCCCWYLFFFTHDVVFITFFALLSLSRKHKTYISFSMCCVCMI